MTADIVNSRSTIIPKYRAKPYKPLPHPHGRGDEGFLYGPMTEFIITNLSQNEDTISEI